MMQFLLPRPTLSDDDRESGIKWLIWEGAATMGYSSITESGFLTAYALLMGANNFQIGLLAALPFLIQPTQFFMIAAVERLKMRKALSVATWMGAQATWIPIALIPFFFGGLSAPSISALLGFVALRSLLAAARNANYNSWVRDLVPGDRLGSFFSRRLTLATLASVVFGLSASFFVDYWKSQNPGDAQVYGYTIALLAGAIFLGIAGPVFLSLVPEPRMQVPDGRRPSLADNIRMPMRDTNFRQLMKFLFFRGFTANLAVPFFAVYMLERIGLSLTAVVALTVVGQIFNVMFLRVWGPMSDRSGKQGSAVRVQLTAAARHIRLDLHHDAREVRADHSPARGPSRLCRDCDGGHQRHHRGDRHEARSKGERRPVPGRRFTSHQPWSRTGPAHWWEIRGLLQRASIPASASSGSIPTEWRACRGSCLRVTTSCSSSHSYWV